jgi:Dynamin family
VVYRGSVDFISLSEWNEELKILIGDCSSEHDGNISLRRREESEDCAAAWSKIDAVYGLGTMKSFDGKAKQEAFGYLSNEKRVMELLTPTNGEHEHRSIEISEGKINATEAKAFLRLLSCPDVLNDKKLARKKRRWADSFRKKINQFVYRKGNGNEPQTWPLIRKVVLRGPWNCLSTGACLVDLPGVRDNNVARAKVAEKYLQKCNKIWIVSPIKRAVDDKTAKDLLGEEFKRRLLMDGNYGNVSFVCTHCDDCEISEILEDHEGTLFHCW